MEILTFGDVEICDFRDAIDAYRPYCTDEDWINFDDRDQVLKKYPKKYPQGVGLRRPDFYLTMWLDQELAEHDTHEEQLEDVLKSFSESLRPQS